MKQKATLESACKGMWVSFPNGYTLSIQHGPGHYCDNRNGFAEDPTSTVEIALLYDDEFVGLNGYDSDEGYYRDPVIGWCPVAALGEILKTVNDFLDGDIAASISEIVEKYRNHH